MICTDTFELGLASPIGDCLEELEGLLVNVLLLVLDSREEVKVRSKIMMRESKELERKGSLRDHEQGSHEKHVHR